MSKATIKEILAQPEAWKETLKDIGREREWLIKYPREINGHELIFTGCGSSYYLALSGASIYSKITNGKARGVPASDILIFSDMIFTKNGKYLTVPISRSGTTTETVRVAQFIKEKLRIETLAISCYGDSKLSGICNRKLIASAAAEESVVMTKSFTSMLLVIQMISAIKSGNKDYEKQLQSLPEEGERIIDKYQSIAKEFGEDDKLNKFIYLGQGPFYGLASESMLKIKEMSCSNSEAYHCLEFRHGPKSIANNKALVTMLSSDSGEDYEDALLKDIKELGARTLVLCDKATEEKLNLADYIIELDSGLSEYARLILYMPITQLIGYYRALSKGLDPDSPKNLTQVVEL
ncbi:MAG: SIS domain-containing protein [candidate division WOR-3 bacterium]|nr:SIS domain-containing protein [candidate division WOR-3 bacterium]